MKRIVIAVDTFGWAFDNIAKQIAKAYGDRYDIAIVDKVDAEHPVECDVFMGFWWKASMSAREWIKTNRFCIGMYDHWSVGGLPQKFARAVGMADCFFAGNEAIQADLKLRVCGKPVYLTEDGVDLDVFTPQNFPDTFTIGWTGNRVYESIGLGDFKGVKLIEEAARRCNVPLVIQDKQVNQLAQAEMPEQFYRKISCYVCASQAEGTPNPVLEALACGRQVISTRVGLLDKLQRTWLDEYEGADCDNSPVQIVERTTNAICERILNRRQYYRNHCIQSDAYHLVEGWDWKEKVKAFEPILEGE